MKSVILGVLFLVNFSSTEAFSATILKCPGFSLNLDSIIQSEGCGQRRIVRQEGLVLMEYNVKYCFNRHEDRAAGSIRIQDGAGVWHGLRSFSTYKGPADQLCNVFRTIQTNYPGTRTGCRSGRGHDC